MPCLQGLRCDWKRLASYPPNPDKLGEGSSGLVARAEYEGRIIDRKKFLLISARYDVKVFTRTGKAFHGINRTAGHAFQPINATLAIPCSPGAC